MLAVPGPGRLGGGPEVLRISVGAGEGGATVVALAGELDIGGASNVRACLADAVTQADVVVDLSELTFIDSTGLGVLVNVHKVAEAVQHTVTLRAPTPNVAKTLAMMGLDKVFPMET